MPNCKQPPPRENKRAFAKAIGHELLVRHGKQRYYAPEQVKKACERRGYPVDWHCWAMSLYVSPDDFAAFHEAIGEVCDQAVMKAEMLAALTDGASESWFSLDLSWLDWPDIDLSSLFDGIDLP